MANLERLYELTKQCNEHNAVLVAVSKTKPTEAIMELYRSGQRIFGENRVQELTDKAESMPKDIQWHMIGHLQRNKVKYIAPFIAMIHSVDRLSLAGTIDKEAEKSGRVIPVLLQVHIADESTKFGFSPDELREVLKRGALQSMGHLSVCGVMGMATFTEDHEQVRREFRSLAALFRELKNSFFADQPDFKEISMGMSGDYDIALEEGSTMIRVGSALFGAR